ncbi:Tryptophan-associated transmembrane protein (Trp_oprn_chp) [Austwickia chelonae]|uniref:Trp biosynthesis-associated membrane protein n=1 Tax=Austwickia chelonae NBRC 105200 TaxID=1184607 RepID=K6ULH2_9MICO|nr:Trp biosynthesis-associated membrane protein [Austwickia chelonae]GAB77246.1 hypothetical protein AUCHE_05_01510 [Austwickia chelonae NBRC 105200]SEW06063.1 Tryptophan-associated transmembrane protein (Trp_oprn_chp) [Austwickia chelonae]
MSLQEQAAQRATAVVLSLLGAAIGLTVSTRTVVSGATVHGGLGVRTVFSVSGTAAAPVYPALLLIAAAGAMVWLFARPLMVRVIAVMTGISGVGAAFTWRSGIVQAGRSPSLPDGHVIQEVSVRWWSFSGDLAALMIVVSAGLALWAAGSWFPAQAGAEAPGGEDASASSPSSRSASDQWERLNRGEDPTV